MGDMFTLPADRIIGRPSYALTLVYSKPLNYNVNLGKVLGYLPIIIFLDTLLWPNGNGRSSDGMKGTDSESIFEGRGEQSMLLGWIETLVEHFFLPATRLQTPFSTANSDIETVVLRMNYNTSGIEQISTVNGLNAKNILAGDHLRVKSPSALDNNEHNEARSRRSEGRDDQMSPRISPGRACVQRFICELQNFKVNDSQLLARVVGLLFTIDPVESATDVSLRPYLSAQNKGRRIIDTGSEEQNCQYSCPLSVFAWLER